MNPRLVGACRRAGMSSNCRGHSLSSRGALSAVAEEIAALTPQQISAIFAKHGSALRLRWQDDPAKSGNDDDLEDIHLHAKLLLSGELVACAARRNVR